MWFFTPSGVNHGLFVSIFACFEGSFQKKKSGFVQLLLKKSCKKIYFS
jgi:hypothetical protein